jgi:hypothetical protein
MAKTIGKRLIADVFDLAFFQDGKIAIVAEDLQSGNIEIKVNEKKVKGGKGNATICTLHSDRDISVKAENPVFDYGVLATNLGSDVVVGNHIAYTQRTKTKVRVDGTTKFIMLGREPLPTEELSVYHKFAQLTKNTDYTISGKLITFLKTDVLEADAVQVDPYKYRTNATAKKISINANTYAKAGTLVLTTYEIDTETNKENQIQFVFPNASPTGNFTVNTKAEVDAASQALEFTINKPDGSDEVGYITEDEYVPEADTISLPTPVVTPIGDLTATSTIASEADFTFTAPTGATSVELLYKLSTDTTYSTVATSGTTGVHMNSPLTATSTSATVLGLTSSDSYNFKLSYVISGTSYESNVATATIA